MLRTAELPGSSLNSPFKGAFGPFCRYSYELEVSEERSSDDQYDGLGQNVKAATAGPRSLALPSSACRGVTRGSSSACAPWVPAFLAATYFQPCERHRHHKKNECTFFCITCGQKPQSVCQHCMGAHAGHQVIQVRRYVYCDVVRTCDINAYVDTTGVQNYIINSAKVMFLNHRPHSKIGRANGVDICRTCQRHLREGYSYCSLACKVEAITKGESAAPATTATPSPTAAAAVAAAAPLAGGVSSCRMESRMAAAGGPASAAAPRLFTSASSAALSPRAGGGGGSGPRGVLPPPSPDSAVVAASYGGGGGSAGLSSDPESSEPGEDTVLYDSASRAYGAVYNYRTSVMAAAAAAAATAQRRSSYGGRRDASGSASSEDDCCDFNIENPPKRRRTTLVGRRVSGCASGLDATAPPAAAAAMAAAAADAAAAATAAATLLLPFRSTSGALSLNVAGRGASLSASGMVPEPPAPAPAVAAALVTGVLGADPLSLRSAASLTLSSSGSLSRRKQNAPQRAPSS